MEKEEDGSRGNYEPRRDAKTNNNNNNARSSSREGKEVHVERNRRKEQNDGF